MIVAIFLGTVVAVASQDWKAGFGVALFWMFLVWIMDSERRQRL